MNILILDLETTGLDTSNDKIIEIGAILYSTSHKRIIKKYSTLVRHSLLDSVPADITGITKINQDMLRKYGTDAEFAFKHTLCLLNEADYVVAHNGTNFDYPMLTSNLMRAGMPTNYNAKKIDTCVDIPYPPHITTRKLIHLMAEHHLAPSQPAHCAIADCESLLNLILCYDIKHIINRADQPNVIIRAVVHREDNNLAKARGFRWTNGKWVKTVKQSEVEGERAACSFLVV